ncbi:MAG TPA: FtsX-like permease family protein [Devosiaceae bacterium]
MRALDKKLLRDFRRLWAQALAIALVMAAGVMTLLIGIGTYRALSETRTAYYQRYEFADLFARAGRTPNAVLGRVAAIDGVATAEGRIEAAAVLDIPGLSAPATGLVLSIPDAGEPLLNRLLLTQGRLPDPHAGGEVAVSGAFAEAHGFRPGDRIDALMNGARRVLTITGIALSPEFIYSVGAGELMPDDKRFGILWMAYSDVAPLYDMKGAFNSLTVKLTRNADRAAVVDRIDRELKPYGGRGAVGRDQQVSHAFLDAELTQLRGMSWILPPVFLGVAAFLVNITLARLVALEREQIGLLKAIGYRRATIAWHYVQFALLIAVVGTLIGSIAGGMLGRGMAALYQEFFKFPFLYFRDSPDIFAIGALAAGGAAVLGSLQAVSATLRLSPAVAMAAPAPPRFRRSILDAFGILKRLPQGLTMALRNMGRTRVRATLTVVGISLATGLLVAGLFSEDSVDFMIDATYFKTERQQASLGFARPIGASGLESVKRLPGVLSVEPVRTVPVEFRHGTRTRRGALTGKPLDADLSRVVDTDLEPVALPEAGVALSDKLAQLLGVKVGDRLEAEILDGRGVVLDLTVAQLVRQYIGLGAYMEIGALNRLLGEGDNANGANLMFDTLSTDDLYAAVKATPAVAGITLQRETLAMFRKTMAENIGISRGIYILLAGIIVFGVVYNSMRIQLSERARELASLRVLGFTRSEVARILLAEVAILTALAIPIGWLVGYGIALGVTEGMQSELYRIPFRIERPTYALAALIVLGAALLSAIVVRRRVHRLDLIAVLKTRD